jgi:hypothetical protein
VGTEGVRTPHGVCRQEEEEEVLFLKKFKKKVKCGTLVLLR